MRAPRSAFAPAAVAFLVLGSLGTFGLPGPAAANGEGCVPRWVDGLGQACPAGEGHWTVVLDDGTRLLTHGGDPIPDGPELHGLTSGTERPPACATTWAQHVLYARNAASPDRFEEVQGLLRRYVREMNALLNEESLASGGPAADYRVLCDAGGDVALGRVVVPSTSNDFGAVVGAARAQGFARSDLDYTIFFDATHGAYCGVGNFFYDDRLTVNNPNNGGGAYGLTYVGCWSGRTPMHENGHNQGAVQRLAPFSDLNAHCLEGYDVMCYTSGTGVPCRDRVHFDCNHDTYFDSAPEPGEWLATHWNIGSPLNRFVRFGGPLVVPPAAPTASAASGDGSVALSWTTPHDSGSPLLGYRVYRDGAPLVDLGVTNAHVDAGLTNGVAYGYRVSARNAGGEGPRSAEVVATPSASNAPPAACFGTAVDGLALAVDAACSTDSDGAVAAFAWDWGDGSARVGGAVRDGYSYAAAGSYVVTLTVRDDDGASASVSRSVTVTVPPDPAPAVPNLVNGEPRHGTLSGMNAEVTYKIFVPGTPAFDVALTGPPCLDVGLCNPDLDLYVKRGAKPTDAEWDCAPKRRASGESCAFGEPVSGWYFVRVKAFRGIGSADYSVVAAY